MKLFDTHCHLDFEVFDEDREVLMLKCAEFGIDKVLIPATSLDSLKKIEVLSRSYEGVYIASGIHPFFVDDASLDQIQRLEEWLECRFNDQKLVAVGEIGLDKFCSVAYELQQQVFQKQMFLAERFGLPVIIHNRRSDQAILRAIDSRSGLTGVIHGFTGSIETAKQFIDRGFKLGIGGAVTWDNARKVKAMVQQLPLESMVLETDAPDMSPQWIRGQRNSSLELLKILRYLSELRGEPVDVISAQLYKNGCDVFKIAA